MPGIVKNIFIKLFNLTLDILFQDLFFKVKNYLCPNLYLRLFKSLVVSE